MTGGMDHIELVKLKQNRSKDRPNMILLNEGFYEIRISDNELVAFKRITRLPISYHTLNKGEIQITGPGVHAVYGTTMENITAERIT